MAAKLRQVYVGIEEAYSGKFNIDGVAQTILTAVFEIKDDEKNLIDSGTATIVNSNIIQVIRSETTKGDYTIYLTGSFSDGSESIGRINYRVIPIDGVAA